MFMFPEPPPLDYYLTDTNPSVLTDGIFHYGKPSGTHKLVAKQLAPIKRKISDPVAAVREPDLFSINRQLEKEKELYVVHPGKDDGSVFETLSMIPKWKREYRRSQQCLESIFPRSQQFELWYIRDRRLKESEKCRITALERARKEEEPETHDEPSPLLKTSSAWKDKPGKSDQFAVGNINDYAYEKLKETHRDVKISKALEMDHPRKYVPGAIHRLMHPEDTSMQNTFKRADEFHVVLKMDETPLNKLSVAATVEPTAEHSPRSPYCNSKARCGKEEIPDELIRNNDKRWQPHAESVELPKTDAQRGEELRNLSKPFLHDLNTWYRKNKPTKSIISLKHNDENVVQGRHFSHL